MDRDAARAIVEREIDPLTARLGLDRWEIAVAYDLRMPDDADGFGVRATCVRRVDYDQAVIRIDPDRFDDAATLLLALRHELFHVVLAPLDVYFNAVAPAFGSNGRLAVALDSVREHAVEQAVIALERMYRGLTGIGPADPTPTAACGCPGRARPRRRRSRSTGASRGDPEHGRRARQGRRWGKDEA